MKLYPISSPGEYRTRGGLKVIIHRLLEEGSFPCAGIVDYQDCQRFTSWQKNGSYVSIVVSHQLDIVGQWSNS